jgi:hypothetical protein
MVTIVGFQERKNSDGKSFFVLELEGGLQINQSQTGKLYATKSKCTVPCSFDEETLEELVGTTLPGNIVRVPCEPYNYENSFTGEIVVLNHRYTYKAEMNVEQTTPPVSPKLREIDVI